MTRQEAFDLNWQHFVTNQKPKCVGPASPGAETNCLYYDPTTQNCCGVGLLMSPPLREYLAQTILPIDELMAELSERVSADPHMPELKTLEQELGMSFLEALQSAHDNVQDNPTLIEAAPVLLGPQPVQFARQLEAVACRFDLKCPQLA